MLGWEETCRNFPRDWTDSCSTVSFNLKEEEFIASSHCRSAPTLLAVITSPVLVRLSLRPAPRAVSASLCPHLYACPIAINGGGGQSRLLTWTTCVCRPQNAEAITWPAPAKLKAGANNSSTSSRFWLTVLWQSQEKPRQMVAFTLTYRL